MSIYEETIGGAEQRALREAETKYVSLRKKIRGPGFDYSSLTNLHPTELKSQELSHVYPELMKRRGGKTCIQCAGKGTYVVKNQSPPPTIALDGTGQESTAATELLNRMDVIRRTTVRAPATPENGTGRNVKLSTRAHCFRNQARTSGRDTLRIDSQTFVVPQEECSRPDLQAD